MKVLLVHPGNKVRVESDEDGVYVVGDVDNADVDKHVYVESNEDYFGFVATHPSRRSSAVILVHRSTGFLKAASASTRSTW
jgi:hypothetical protein